MREATAPCDILLKSAPHINPLTYLLIHVKVRVVLALQGPSDAP